MLAVYDRIEVCLPMISLVLVQPGDSNAGRYSLNLQGSHDASLPFLRRGLAAVVARMSSMRYVFAEIIFTMMKKELSETRMKGVLYLMPRNSNADPCKSQSDAASHPADLPRFTARNERRNSG